MIKYEKAKAELLKKNLTPKEYEQAIKQLVNALKV